jgi:hypothetical protein
VLSDLPALLSTATALAIGLVLALVCSRYLKVKTDALLVAVLFAPVLFFLGLSGRLVEFKGLGLEAKFQQVAARVVTPTTVKPVSSSAPAIQRLSEVNAFMGVGSDVVLLQATKEDIPVTRQRVLDVALQIYPGLLQGSFELLVVVDPAYKVIGYFPREYFYDLLRIEIEQTIRGARTAFDSVRVGEQLEQTQLWDVVQYPRIRSEASGTKLFVQTSDSNAAALGKLASANLGAAVVVDPAGGYSGIVRRNDIVAELLGALAGTGKPASPK